MWESVLLLGLLLLLGHGAVVAQTGSEFWFDVPEANRMHSKITCKLHVTALTEAAEIHISLPAVTNPIAHARYASLTRVIPAGTRGTIDLATGVGSANSLFFHDVYGGIDYSTVSAIDQDLYIENVLAWTQSHMDGPQPFLNRSNKGVYLKAVNPTTNAPVNVNAYIEYGGDGNEVNIEVIPLKGPNALGTHFFVPMQTKANITQYDPKTYVPYPSINIVATQDNTHLKITVPTHGVLPQALWSASSNAGGNFSSLSHNIGSMCGQKVYHIWLNRGQTSILTPFEEERDAQIKYQTSTSGSAMLEGTEIEVLSGGPVAVTTRADNLRVGGAVDMVVDQLVPVNLVGTNYAVVAGPNTGDAEYIYILSTEEANEISVPQLSYSKTLSRGEQLAWQ